MAATIGQKFSIKAELIEGDKGIFDVKVDGDLIFSKFAVDRFPSDDEICDLLQAR